MQSKIFIAFFIMVCLLMPPPARVSASPPDWFLNLPHKDYELVGYGEGRTLDEALAKAKKGIAQSIRTRIRSESVFEERLANKDYSRNARTLLQERTDVVLSDLETVRKEHRDGLWYIAVKYENLPFPKKFSKRLSHRACEQGNQNRYLSCTPLIKALNAELGCSPAVKLLRNHGLWYLACEDVMLPLGSAAFEKLYASCPSPSLSLVPSKTDLRKGDAFSVTLRPLRDGFVSLLNVYESGEVSVILANRSAQASEDILCPDPAANLELVAGLVREGEATFDLYVGFLSPEKVDLGRIQQAGDQVSSGERHFKFDEVLGLMDNVEFCTVLIRTRPKDQ